MEWFRSSTAWFLNTNWEKCLSDQLKQLLLTSDLILNTDKCLFVHSKEPKTKYKCI